MALCEHARFQLLPIARGAGITTIFVHAAFQFRVDLVVGEVWQVLERGSVKLFGKLQLLGFGQGEQCWEAFEDHSANPRVEILIINPFARRRRRPTQVAAVRGGVTVEGDELTFDWPLAFDMAKDKPVLITAFACADVLLTLDRRDFRTLLGQSVSDLRVLTPGEFPRIERRAGRLL
jgi:hypothetical protein